MKFLFWLKGSRKTYYLSPMMDQGEDRLVCNSSSEKNWRYWARHVRGSATQINRGPFRRRSRIYGPAEKNWQLVKASLNNGGGEVVELLDKQGVVLEDALRLINTYPSLQAMLDRIAKLEKDLSIANNRREELNIGIQAVLNLINSDRQKFRSPTNRRVREVLEEVRRDEPEVAKDKVFSWAMKHIK